MKLQQEVFCAIDDMVAGKFDSALLHACITIDTTARRMYPRENRVGVRYVSCLREFYWLIEPTFGGGINFVDTKFKNIQLKKNNSPDLAQIIYEIFRCSHAHGDEVPEAYSVCKSTGGFGSEMILAHNELHLPDRIVWSLLFVAVMAKVNHQERKAEPYYLSLGDERFTINDWWGREDDFRPIASRYNQVRVTMEGLDRFPPLSPGETVSLDNIDLVMIQNPPLGSA